MNSDFPHIPHLSGWEHPKVLLEEECRQSLEEGRDPGAIEKIKAQIACLDDTDDERLTRLWYAMQDIPIRKDFSFVEPSDLDAIRSERTNGPRLPPISHSDDVLYDRMLGAWLGRCAGCALGKPVEFFMGPHNGLSSRERTKTYLQAILPEEYPIRNYIPGASPASAQTGKVTSELSTREKIAFMESDDDIRYTVIGQRVMLKHGVAFTSNNVVDEWMEFLPYQLVCTAEMQAYRNIVIRYRPSIDFGAGRMVDWNWIATHQNPYREWIGAQIRADSWGYAAPGNPELAAEFAWRDARITHVKNGIYGEMFCAAMIAAGFATTDALRVVEAGLAEIPHRSRLYSDMRDTIGICREHGFRATEFEAVLDRICSRFADYHPVHTNNNAALVAAALLLGGDDFEKVITIAVMGGWDTDCNAATAGSVWGAMFGAGRIPQKWSAPLNDTLYSLIPDYHPIAISECARRSVRIARG
jgi:ADP-ribosylglycohydrolase